MCPILILKVTMIGWHIQTLPYHISSTFVLIPTKVWWVSNIPRKSPLHRSSIVIMIGSKWCYFVQINATYKCLPWIVIYLIAMLHSLVDSLKMKCCQKVDVICTHIYLICVLHSWDCLVQYFSFATCLLALPCGMRLSDGLWNEPKVRQPIKISHVWDVI